jgi:hypothetical protein
MGELKPGLRLRSATCPAEVIVIKAPAGEIDLRCGGHPLLPVGPTAGDGEPDGVAARDGFDGGLLIGKRYTDGSGDLEVLCTKAGTSSLSLGDDVLTPKDAKPLPSSD